jgi:hypothetical protein
MKSFLDNHDKTKDEIKKHELLKVCGDTLSFTLDSLNKLQNDYLKNNGKIYILFDNHQSKINLRKIITNGTYKSARDENRMPDEFYSCLDDFKKIIELYRSHFHTLYVENYEADDLTKPLALILKDDILFISADLDWSRNITGANHWCNYHVTYNQQTYKEKYGFTPNEERVKIYKTFRGDDSDSIPIGLPKIPSKLIYHIMDTYEDKFTNYILHPTSDNVVSETWVNKINENRKQLLENYKLVGFIPFDSDIRKFINQGQNKDSEIFSIFKKYDSRPPSNLGLINNWSIF